MTKGKAKKKSEAFKMDEKRAGRIFQAIIEGKKWPEFKCLFDGGKATDKAQYVKLLKELLDKEGFDEASEWRTELLAKVEKSASVSMAQTPVWEIYLSATGLGLIS